jgi:membrane protease YdiL (CAAX protease family)
MVGNLIGFVTMKACDYCGRKNEDIMAFCAECGTAFTMPDASSAKLPLNITSPLELNARSATFIFLAYLVAQLLCGVLWVALARGMAASQGIHDVERILRIAGRLMPTTMLLALVLGGGAMIFLSSALIPRHLRNTSADGAAWVPGPWGAIAKAFVLGLAVGACAWGICSAMKIHVVYKNLGPLARMALTPGSPQIIWGILAILLAPPVEELLFRGVLYGGYRKSFGPQRAAIFTTLIFLALHVPEVIHFLPAIGGLMALSLAALWCRLRSRAIGPAIAVHVGYNLSIAFVVLLNAKAANP